MQHFVQDDGFNVFRLPTSWQYMVNGVLGGQLNATNAGIYDQLVQACLLTGAMCIIDVSTLYHLVSKLRRILCLQY
jgi:endoglucanase